MCFLRSQAFDLKSHLYTNKMYYSSNVKCKSTNIYYNALLFEVPLGNIGIYFLSYQFSNFQIRLTN